MKEIIAYSAEIKSLLRALDIAAATDVTLLLQGESGTGKEIMAHRVHRSSRRHDRPMVCLNCAAIPEGLAEATLFGHMKGAFTSADTAGEGYLQAAHGGTVFLDEISELSPGVQAKLLRFLESGEIQPVGATATRRLDVRVIAASNTNLARSVDQGKFRADLYYRLNILPFDVPALRERRDDIEPLVKFYLDRLSEKYSLTAPRFTATAKKRLDEYPWPGNVRELKNFCERMLILCPGQTLDVNNLPVEMRQRVSGNPFDGLFSLPDGGLSLNDLEASMISQALYKAGGNQSRAARLLGLTRDTLLYRIKKYGLSAG